MYRAIADLCKAVLAEGHKTIGHRAKLNVGVSTFIPKPHTPFQWVACDSVEQIQAKQALLKQELRHRDIKLTWTNPEVTMLEAWLSRGDRRMADVVYQAWKNGARFDAWQDQFNFNAWTDAFESAHLDPSFYTHRARSHGRILSMGPYQYRCPQEIPAPGFQTKPGISNPNGLPLAVFCLWDSAHLC